jgi:hypothetical protein
MHNCAIYPLELFNKKTTQASILNVEPAVDGNYFIYTTDGPMTNRNSLLLGKFNAHDIQTYIFKRHDDGDSLFCKIQTAGFRMYGPGKINSVPNITSIIC